LEREGGNDNLYVERKTTTSRKREKAVCRYGGAMFMDVENSCIGVEGRRVVLEP